jgi:hypothetical protein
MQGTHLRAGPQYSVEYCLCSKCFTVGPCLFGFWLADQSSARSFRTVGFCNLSAAMRSAWSHETAKQVNMNSFWSQQCLLGCLRLGGHHRWWRMHLAASAAAFPGHSPCASLRTFNCRAYQTCTDSRLHILWPHVLPKLCKDENSTSINSTMQCWMTNKTYWTWDKGNRMKPAVQKQGVCGGIAQRRVTDAGGCWPTF